jgi:hypothetical protein
MSRTYDWHVIPTDYEERVFEVNSADDSDVDLTDNEITAHFDVNGVVHVAEAEIAGDPAEGKVRVALTGEQTAQMRVIGSWFVQRRPPTEKPITIAHGWVYPDVR